MKVPTESKVLYEHIDQIIEPYKDLAILNYDRLYNVPADCRDKEYEYKLSDYLDFLTCIAFEVENENETKSKR